VVCAPTSGEYGTSVPLRKDVKCALLGKWVVNYQPPCDFKSGVLTERDLERRRSQCSSTAV